MATDTRFASRERAVFAQHDIGFGVLPGGGGLEWLSQHVGWSRTIEIAVIGDDFDAETAGRYGWINRAVPDGELDEFVDRFARRVASFRREALVTIKCRVNERSAPPSEGELQGSFATILELAQSPGGQARISSMLAKAFSQSTEVELNNPRYTPLLTEELGLDD